MDGPAENSDRPIRERRAFPGPYEAHGMTYRQWLIGQALTGVLASGEKPQLSALQAIEAADAVLTHLDEEIIDEKTEEKADGKTP